MATKEATNKDSIHLWETFDNDEDLLINSDIHLSMIDDVVSGDFLLMDVEVDYQDHSYIHAAHGSSDDNWELMGDGGNATHRSVAQLPPLYDDDVDESGVEDGNDYEEDSDEAPRTPFQAERQVIIFKGENVHEITPEQQSPPKFNLPDLAELHTKCQRTLQKLANSMRRSDETRSIVKCQRLQRTVFKETEIESNFSIGHRASAIEESRRKIYQMISMGVTCTMDSRF